MAQTHLGLDTAADAVRRRALETGHRAEAALQMQGVAPQQLADTLTGVTSRAGQEFSRNTRRSRAKLRKVARRGSAELSQSAQEAAHELTRIAAEAQEQAARMVEQARDETAAHAARARRRGQWRRWWPWLLAATLLGGVAAGAVVYLRSRSTGSAPTQGATGGSQQGSDQAKPDEPRRHSATGDDSGDGAGGTSRS